MTTLSESSKKIIPKSSKQLKDIKLPLYAFPKYYKVTELEGVLLMQAPLSDTVYILDDRNLEGSYPERRLQIKRKPGGSKLYKLKWVVDTLDKLIAGTKSWSQYAFIDNEGSIFRLKPYKYYKVRNLRVLSQKIKEGSHTLIYVEDLFRPLKIKAPLKDIEKGIWVSILDGPTGPIILKFSSTPPTRKTGTRKR